MGCGELHKKVINGREDTWNDYCKLCKEVKELVVAKKLTAWEEASSHAVSVIR